MAGRKWTDRRPKPETSQRGQTRGLTRAIRARWGRWETWTGRRACTRLCLCCSAARVCCRVFVALSLHPIFFAQIRLAVHCWPCVLRASLRRSVRPSTVHAYIYIELICGGYIKLNLSFSPGPTRVTSVSGLRGPGGS